MSGTSGPVSISDQVRYLYNLGMYLPDTALAERCLTHIGFHRLIAYWRPFETPSKTAFRKGTNFNAVMTRYLFDERLRSFLLEAFSYIEVSMRTNWAYHLDHVFQKGEFAHRNAALFDEKHYKANLGELERNYQRIRYQPAYNFQTLSIWELISAMSFGQLSKWFNSLNDRAIRQSIAQTYGMDESVLRPALRHLAKIRNVCAHHEKLWDAPVTTKLRLPRSLNYSAKATAAFTRPDDGKVYNALVMVMYLLDVITPHGDWSARLLALKEKSPYSGIPDEDMGFPQGWREYDFWQERLL